MDPAKIAPDVARRARATKPRLKLRGPSTRSRGNRTSATYRFRQWYDPPLRPPLMRGKCKLNSSTSRSAANSFCSPGYTETEIGVVGRSSPECIWPQIITLCSAGYDFVAGGHSPSIQCLVGGVQLVENRGAYACSAVKVQWRWLEV